MITFYSIIISLKNEMGHFFEYNSALSKAIKIINCNHIKIIPKNAQIQNLDNSWQKAIYQIEHKNKLKNLKNLFPFVKIFRQIKKKKNAILFLEDFNLAVLILILLSAVVIRPKAQLWLFQRFEYDKTFLNGRAYRVIQYLLEKILKKENVKYLTDSELIANINGYYFDRKFVIFPIPHTKVSQEKKIIKKEKFFWWPGGLIRKEKGLDNIKNLLLKIKPKDNIKIVIADVAKTIIKSENVEFITTNLTREEYERWMMLSDLILLPYISDLYSFRTSGIFVEAIIAGSIPVVSPDTWMSYELLRYNLEELILDWRSDNIIFILNSIASNLEIQKKISLMKNDYEKTHSIDNYAKILESLL